MRRRVGVLVALGLAASVAAVGAQSVIEADEDEAPAENFETASIAAPGAPGRYYLTSMDDGQRCVIDKGAAENGLATIKVTADCELLVPGMSGATVWRENADGTVSLGSETSAEIAQFAQADGEDYESFLPAWPLMVLAEAD